jgi:hypothetical protein
MNTIWMDRNWIRKTNSVMIVPPTAPIPTSPANGTTFAEELPTLKWQAVKGAMGYVIQIAENSAFNDIISDEWLSETEYGTSRVVGKNGTFHWRVRAEGETGRSQWSDVRSFQIAKPVVNVQVARQEGLDAVVEVRVEQVKEVYGFQFDLWFDSSLLKVVEVKPGDFLGRKVSWTAPEIDNDSGWVKGVTALKTGGRGASGKGTLARITFKAKKITGQSELRLRSITLTTPAGETLKHFIEPNSIRFPAP